ncbi:MAG: FkbM family methyltransferase [bacterium]|nr:FkbM family methyltransferase [bacterium]
MGYFNRLRELFFAMRTISTVYGRGSRALLWFRMMMTVMQPRLPKSIRRAQRLGLVFEGTPFSVWMLDRTSLAAFEEVFIHGEYFVPDIPAPRIVVDAGANIGVASVYFCLRYSGARIYTIEPNPEVLDTLRKNLSVFPNASVHQCALSDADGTIDFHIHPTSSIASSLQSRVSGERIVAVPTKKLDTFMKEQNISEIDLLKFDIEGAEGRFLGAIKNRQVVRTYVGEIHPDLMHESLEEIRALFAGFSVTTNPVGSKRFLITAERSS